MYMLKYIDKQSNCYTYIKYTINFMDNNESHYSDCAYWITKYA